MTRKTIQVTSDMGSDKFVVFSIDKSLAGGQILFSLPDGVALSQQHCKSFENKCEK